jgi:hypothetical protein
MTNDVFEQWLNHSEISKVSESPLHTFDDATVRATESHGITLYSLPNNTPRDLQPFDMSALKYRSDELSLLWGRNRERNFTKSRFGAFPIKYGQGLLIL